MVNDFNMWELYPRYDSRKSFYGKAMVIERRRALYLRSYSTIVCGVVNGRFVRYWGGWSATTGRHINEFSRQFTGRVISKKEWDALPVEVLK